MQLDRDINPDGRGKYALVRLRHLPERPRDAAHLAATALALMWAPIVYAAVVGRWPWLEDS